MAVDDVDRTGDGRAPPRYLAVNGEIVDNGNPLPTGVAGASGNNAAVINTSPASNEYGLVVRPVITEEFWHQVAAGNVPGHSIVHKFGTNQSVGTTYVPLAVGGMYQTPQVASATKVRVKAGNANDTAAGSGARAVEIQGLDETGAMVSEQLATAGASAGANSLNDYIRLFRGFVCESGTYSTQVAGSHADDVTIEDEAGANDWLTIDATDFPKGQSQIAAYTVPLGFTAYVSGFYFSIDSNKTADLLLFRRSGVLDTSPPYEAMRAITEFGGLSAPFHAPNVAPLGPFPALTDLGFMAKVTSTTGAISADFEILLIADGF